MADTPNQYNQNLQNPNDILSSLQTLINTTSAQPVPNLTVPTLNFTMPTGSDIQSEYQKFLQDAANDPNIVNYYQQLLSYAQGDTNVAIQQLKTDYSTGVRQTTDTLKNSLEQLGLTFTGESNQMLDQLNKRGIALTQEGNNGSLTYAGGGQAGTELDTLNQSQKLRQEAQQRSAQQNIENAGLSLNKGITGANEALQNQAINLQQQKQGDIVNRANVGYSAWQNKQALNAQKALYAQSSGGSGNSINKSSINPATGQAYAINPATGVWDDNYFSQKYG